jgi:hypothetical protein
LARLTDSSSSHIKDFQNLATVHVGPRAVEYTLHRDALCAQSPFFAAALTGGFAEAASQRVTLPDVDPRHFDYVARWVYSGRIEPEASLFKDGKPTYFLLLELWSLADRLALEGLRNGVADTVARLAHATNSVPTPSDTHILYGGRVRETAPLRALALDLFAFKKTDQLLATHPDDWHPRFLRELACKLKRPGAAAVRRHDLQRWTPPARWEDALACELCHRAVMPAADALLCVLCRKAFCRRCLQAGEYTGTLDWTAAEQQCKPWVRNKCLYHEHLETEPCPQVEATPVEQRMIQRLVSGG